MLRKALASSLESLMVHNVKGFFSSINTSILNEGAKRKIGRTKSDRCYSHNGTVGLLLVFQRVLERQAKFISFDYKTFTYNKS